MNELEEVVKSKILIQGYTCFQPVGENPRTYEVKFERELTTHEEMYSRKIRIQDNNWIPLNENCWLEDCSLVEIDNLAGTNLQKYPTPEEQSYIDQQIVEITFNLKDPHIPIFPSETQRFGVVDFNKLAIRCKLPTSVRVRVYPK